jgi:lipopolysaccharide/colanic/teichoic acid biosynthesis glycosyltransferase
VLTGWDWTVKRGFDLVVSALVVVIGLPVWALVALAIKLDSRGPIFFVDRRIGVGEREFPMLKFRTMVADAAELQPELEDENEAEGALFKIREDPRVTRVGKFLRRFSLDEIPQVLNVLKGEMSLVGPRPLPLRDYELLEDWHRRRYGVLPGMTGLWQISGRSGLSFDDLVRLDFTYIENWSLWLDISIIVKTIPAVITQRGAY